MLTIEELERFISAAKKANVEFVTIRTPKGLWDVKSASIEDDKGQTESKVLVLTP